MTILYFFIQLSIIIAAVDRGNATINSLGELLGVAGMGTGNTFTFVDGKNLRLCSQGIARATSDCPVVFPAQGETPIIPASNEPSFQIQPAKRDESRLVPVLNGDNLTSLLIVEANDVITLTPTCLHTLQWSFQTVVQIWKSDIVTASYQALLLLLSVAAIFAESIPLAWSSLMMHVLALVWSVLRLGFSISFKSDYTDIVTSASGACGGFDPLQGYFKLRGAFEIALVILDVATLLLASFLTWRLAMQYGLTFFKQLAAPKQVRSGYLMALLLFAVIPLATFFHIASTALWLEEIMTHFMGAKPSHINLNIALNTLSAVLVIPWLGLAFVGVRRESKILMGGFLVGSALYLIGFGVMLKSMTFQRSLRHWPLLTAMFTLTILLAFATIAIAIICMSNFGSGLSAQMALQHAADSEEGAPINEKPDLEKLTLPISGDFVVTFPDQDRLENLPKRSDSLSSTSSASSKKTGRVSFAQLVRGSRVPIVAALPGAVKIAPPPTAAKSTLSPSNSIRTIAKSSWKYAQDQPFWGKSKRSVSTISAASFGHMDASKLDGSYIQPGQLSQAGSEEPIISAEATISPTARPMTPSERLAAKRTELGGRPKVGLPATPSANLVAPIRYQTPRVDSMGSLGTEPTPKHRLFLVNANDS